MQHTITIMPALNRLGIPSTTHYAVLYHGKLLIDSTITPFCSAARELQALGKSGKLVMMDQTRKYARMVGTIEKAAKLTVAEGEGRTRFVKYEPHPRVASA